MKRFLSLWLVLLSVLSQAQTINFTADTLLRVPGRSRIAFPDGANPYLVPAVGNAALLFNSTAKTVSQLRALTGTVRQQLPDVITTTDPLTGGQWRLDAADKSSADNGGTVLVTANGFRYKRYTPDNRITPQMFGAVGDSLTDDAVALQKWLNATGTYELFLPAGKYRSSTALTRTNKGTITIRGAGQFRSVIHFSNDTDGLSVVNTNLIDGMTGAGIVTVTDLAINSVGTKSANRTALYLTTHHYSRPGPTIKNVAVKSLTAGMEWEAGISLFDCSASTLEALTIWSASTTATTGIRISGSNGLPTVEHSIKNFSIQNVKRGIEILPHGAPATEGVNIADGNIVTCFQGVWAKSDYGAPVINITDLHVNSFGGEALYVDGFQQMKISGAAFYVNAATNGVIPLRGAYINNTILSRGDIFINLLDNIPNGLYLAGSGGGVNMHIAGAVNSAQSNVVKVDTTLGAQLCVERVWTGNTTWGSAQGKSVYGPYVEGCAPIKGNNNTATDRNVLQYNGSNYQYSPVKLPTINAATELGISASTTVDPSAYDLVRVYNGSTPITITLDYTKVKGGERVSVIRGDDASTGAITIQTSSPTVQLMQSATGAYQSSYALPTTKGARQVSLILANTHVLLAGAGVTSDYNELLNKPSMVGIVRGDFDVSRAKNITVISADLPSGFYTLSSATNMPADPSGFNSWFVIVNRVEGGDGSGSRWSGMTAVNLKTKATYTGGYDAQTNALIAWTRVHDNRMLPVSESVLATTAGQTLISDGTQFTNGFPKHVTGGSVSPTVSTSTGAGTSPTVSLSANSEVSTDLSGVISLATGTSPANGLIVRVTYAGAYTRIPKVTIDGANDAAVLNRTLYRVSNRTTTGFDLVNTSSNTLPASTTFLITYTVTE